MRKLRILLSLLLSLAGNLVYAQETVEMADTMRANGKIYVIVAIILIVLAGLISYLFVLDRKITRLERELPAKKD